MKDIEAAKYVKYEPPIERVAIAANDALQILRKAGGEMDVDSLGHDLLYAGHDLSTVYAAIKRITVLGQVVEDELRPEHLARIGPNRRKHGMGYLVRLIEARPPSDKAFVFSTLQSAIWKALEGRALKKQPLADEVCAGEGTRLYRNGGIKELIDAGRVAHKNGVGYYRPDAPPPDLVP